MKLEYTNIESSGYITVFNILKSEFHLSDRLILKLKREKQIYIHGEPTHVKKELVPGDVVSVDISFTEDYELSRYEEINNIKDFDFLGGDSYIFKALHISPTPKGI